MSNVGFKGLNVRQTGNELVFRAFLQTSAGALVTSGTTNFYILELQSDGSIKTYDFNDNTFKTTACTTENLAGAYKKSNNAATDTGLWTASLATLTGFTVGGIYLVRVNNSTASPTDQMREFQYGSAEGDLLTVAVSTGTADLQTAPDWAHVQNPTTNLDLSGTTIKNVDNAIAAVTTVTNLTNAPTNGDLTATMKTSVQTSAAAALTAAEPLPSVGYYGGAVWIDSLHGAAGTTAYVNGLPTNPSSTIADATTLATALGLKRFEIAESSSITLAATMNGYIFNGAEWILIFNGQSVPGCRINGAHLSGTAVVAASPVGCTLYDCHLNTCTLNGVFSVENSQLVGPITIVGSTDFLACYGEPTCTIDFNLGATTEGDFSQFAGSLLVKNMVAGSVLNVWGRGTVTIDATCTGGTVSMFGEIKFTNSGSGMTLNQDGRYAQSQILSDATPFPGAAIDAHVSSRSTLTQSQILSDATPFAGADIDAKISTRSTLSAGAQMDLINSPNATALAAISAALLKLDWTTLSGEASHSALNALRFLRNTWSISGATLTVDKEDGTTAWTGTVTTNSAAQPVTGNTVA